MVKKFGSYPAAQALIDRAMKVDPALAADIRAFARSREYGLVFEHNRPEAMRLYGKPINEGDVVHILPERGLAETEENRAEWNVLEVCGDVVKLQQVDDEDAMREAALADVVAVAEYDQPIYAGLRETDRVERGGGALGDPGDKPHHVVINGENYHALEALEFCYAGKVDCIYIDPPYNTGAKDWKYNNDYVDGTDAYRHSKWLAWMERRLKLAKALLNPESSVLILAIDEKEYLRLGLLLEQTFPEAEIQMVSSVINVGGSVRAGAFSRTDEYLFFVRLGESVVQSLSLGSEWRGGKSDSTAPVLWRSMRRGGDAARREDRPGMFYPVFVNGDGTGVHSIGDAIPLSQDRNEVVAPSGTIAIWPMLTDKKEGRWRVGVETSRNNHAHGYIRANYKKDSITISYLAEGIVKSIQQGEISVLGRERTGEVILEASEKDYSIIPGTAWSLTSHNARDYGSKLVKQLTGRAFPFPKSLHAVEDALRFFVTDKPNALIVDFFAGSGTTAHAVMRLNHQDNGNRCCVSVTNNEVSCDEEAALTSKNLRKSDEEWEKFGIAKYVTWPRIKAAITGMTPDGKPVKGEYGIKVDEYQEVDGDVVDPETGKKMRGKLYKKVVVQSKSVPDPFPMSDGFDENAVFFDLTYEDPDMVGFGMAFSEIAPLLWMRAGCRGRIIEHEADDFAVTDNYAVLFEYACMGAFAKAIKDNDSVGTVFVVTDDDHRFANAKRMFPGRDVVRLYESYLHSFQIASEGALS